MSMEAYVLCRNEINSYEEWQIVIDRLKFGVELQNKGKIRKIGGHMPATWRGLEAGFEFTSFSFAALEQVYPNIDFGRSWPFAYAFYFHTLTGCVSTWLSLAACVQLTNGVAYDPQEGRLLAADDAVRYARETEASFYQIQNTI